MADQGSLQTILPEASTPPDDAATDEEVGEELLDVMDYLKVDSRRYAFKEMSRLQSLGYFMPLLHELFAGGDAKTKIVYTILHSLMTDDRVRWTRGELDEKFHWLKDGHRGYLLHRLSNVGWLEYYRDQSAYMISDKGEALMRILSRFALGSRLVENEGAALAEIEFSLLLELDDLPERLQFLRNRLLKHSIRAEHALESDSAYRILQIYQQLRSAHRWAEQTRQTLDHVEVEDDESPQWGAIRAVHNHLSRLHSLISKMQLVLQDIQNKQIDVSRYGLTHLDFDNFLINSKAESLAELMTRHLDKIPHPFYLLEDNAFTEAAEILSRQPEQGTPRGWETDVTELGEGEDEVLATDTTAFVRDLTRAPEKWAGVEQLVQTVTWEVAAYRFSMLTVLADLDPASRENAEAALDPLINVPVEAKFDKAGKMVEVAHGDDTWAMTKCQYRRDDAPTPT